MGAFLIPEEIRKKGGEDRGEGGTGAKRGRKGQGAKSNNVAFF